MYLLRTLVIAAWATIAFNGTRLEAEVILFAIQEDGAIAGSLPYGSDPITEASSAYLNNTFGDQLHDRWFQRGVDGVGNTLYEIDWQFSDVKTIADRFQSAVDSGETVNWTVTSPLIAGDQGFTGTWVFSSTAADFASKFANGSSGFDFVSDTFPNLSGTGIWGAGPGVIDGSNLIFDDTATDGWDWGFGNLNGDDDFLPFANSGTLMINGELQSALPSGFKNLMYVDTASVPEPSSVAMVGVAIAFMTTARRRRSRCV